MKCAPILFLLSAALLIGETATIRIDATLVENHVSTRMYGAFVEMMAEDIKRGITAEMIHGRSFEEPANYLGLPAPWQLEPDERNDNVGAIKFSPVTDDAYPKTNSATGRSEHSLRVTLAPEDITDTRRGFSQGRLSVRANQPYTGYAWIKKPAAKGYSGTITVALEEDNTDGETYAQVDLPAAGNDEWKQLHFTLSPAKTDRFAKLTILFGGRGTLYLDQLSLQPADAKDAVRADSEAMIAKLKPSFLRWPGGNVAQDYHWQWGIGPRDLRPVWTNAAWSNAPEPNDLGTDEYLALCDRLHIEPSITVNANGAGASATEAAAWVEYVNGPAASKYGSLRAANGHPKPYQVKYWELGNEVYGNWVRGHVDGATYARAAVQYAQAMRAVSPGIKFIAVGQGVGKEQQLWNTAVLKIAGPLIDYLAIHDYTSLSKNVTVPNSRAQMMARAGEFEEGYRSTGKLISKLVPDRKIKLIVNEWNLFYDASVVQSMEGAVYASRMMNGFERQGDIVEANSISDLLNGWIGGVIQASRDRVYGTPQFYAIKMYRDHLGTERLSSQVESPELAVGVKSCDAVATRSADGSRLFVKLSNAAAERPIETNIDLRGFAYQPEVRTTVLSAAGVRKRNTFADPEAVRPVEKTIRCSNICSVALPANSVAVVEFRKQ